MSLFHVCILLMQLDGLLTYLYVLLIHLLALLLHQYALLMVVIALLTLRIIQSAGATGLWMRVPLSSVCVKMLFVRPGK